VLKTICSYDYLWTNIRVLGGAYGAILVANNKVGFAFVSYRDPHIKSTNNVYDKLPSFLSSINYKKEEIEKYIIGTLSTFDMPKSNYLNFIYNISKYYNKITNKDEVKQRNEIINTNINSINKVIKFLLKDYKKSGYTVISSNTKIKNENNNYYKEVKKINV
jgi:Zn-dependent M16 (insulinase) family peptidase